MKGGQMGDKKGKKDKAKDARQKEAKKEKAKKKEQRLYGLIGDRIPKDHIRAAWT